MNTKLTEARITVLEAQIAKIKTQRHQIDKRMSAEIEHAKQRVAHWTTQAADLESRCQKGGIRDDERVAKLEDQIEKLRGVEVGEFA